MWKDPIVEEIHPVREEIARRFNGGLEAIAADMRRRQEASLGRVVRQGELAGRAARERVPAGVQKEAG